MSCVIFTGYVTVFAMKPYQTVSRTQHDAQQQNLIENFHKVKQLLQINFFFSVEHTSMRT